MKSKSTDDKLRELRKRLDNKEAATMHTKLSAIELDENSLIKGVIGISGREVKVDDKFFLSLSSMLKMNQSLSREMIKNEDGKFAAKMMSVLKTYRSSTEKGSGNEVLLIGNPVTKRIVDVMKPERYRRLTNDSIYNVTERILDTNPGLQIETVDMDARGQMSINLLNDSEVGFPSMGKDEFFKFGFSLIQTSKDTLAETYNQRLVCTNGMRSSLGSGAIGGSQNKSLSFTEKIRLNGHGVEDIAIFLKQIEAMNKAKFVPAAFEDTLHSAINTKASLIEVQAALNLAHDRVDKNDDPDLISAYLGKINREYFHGYDDAMHRLAKKGQDPLLLNDRHRSFIKTNQSVWDVVNSLTFLGSNNTGIPFKNEHDLKVKAGHLFGKGTTDGYDLQFAKYANM